MKQWIGLFVILLAAPVFGGDRDPQTIGELMACLSDDPLSNTSCFGRQAPLVVSVHNVDKLAAKFADWRTTFGYPEGRYQFRSVLLCRNRAWGVPMSEPQLCYPVTWARSLDGGLGYARVDESYPGMKTEDATAWYRVSRKWNSRLEWRLRPKTTSDSSGPAAPQNTGADEWKPFPPGNTNNDRYAPGHH